MGKEANLKALRKQLRNIVDEDMITKILSEKTVSAIRTDLTKLIVGSLDTMNKSVFEKLEQIEARNKDIQAMVIREKASNEGKVEQALLVDVTKS